MSVDTVHILIDGIDKSSQLQITHVDVLMEANRIPSAEIKLIEPNIFREGFQVSNSGQYLPGQKIGLQFRRLGKKEEGSPLFEGVVVKQEICADLMSSHLTLYLKDPAFKMAAQRKSTVFEQKTDSEIIRELLDAYPDVNAGNIPITGLRHSEMIQYYCSDWDFMLARAEANGWLVYVEKGTVNLIEPDLSGASEHTFDLDLAQIRNLEMTTDLSHQYQTISSQGWNLSQNEPFLPEVAAEQSLYPGNILPGQKASSIGREELALVSGTPTSREELAAWSKAQMVKSRLAMVRGKFQIPGKEKVTPGQILELIGFAKAVNGKSLITGVRQQITLGGWETMIQIGLSPQWFTAEPDVMDTPAAGLLPGVTGIQMGIVQPFEADPKNLGRVRVQLSRINGVNQRIWARLSSPDSGEESGIFFRPEPGDEVVIGFVNDDPRQAVILGSLHNPLRKAPFDIQPDNPQKGMVTRTGLQFILDDVKKTILIQTPQELSIQLDESGSEIRIQDKVNNSEITLDSQGITLKSSKNITIDAGSNLTLKSGTKIELAAPSVNTK